MKSISPVVATILLIVILVAIASTAFLWISGYFQNLLTETQKQVQTLTDFSILKVDSYISKDKDLALGMDFEDWYFCNCEDNNCDVCFRDISDYHNDGVFYGNIKGEFKGNPKWVKGKYGYALEFDGVDDYVEVPASVIDPIVDSIEKNDKITIIAIAKPERWLYYGGTCCFPIVEKYEADNDWGWSFGFKKDAIGFYANNEEYINCYYNFDLNNWYFVAMTYDRSKKEIIFFVGNKTNLYICKKTFNGDIQDTSGEPLYIAFSPAGAEEYSSGAIDEILIYSRALSEDEIKACYQDIKNCPRDDSLVLHLSFDEGKGKYVNDLSFIKKGKWGYYVEFDGKDDYIEVVADEIPTKEKGKITVNFWMYWTGKRDIMPIGFYKYDLWIDEDDDFGFNTAEGDINGICDTFTSTNYGNKWLYISAIFCNGYPTKCSNTLYLNSNKITLKHCQGTIRQRNLSKKFRISGWTYNDLYKYKGFLDELYIFSRALSPKEVSLLYRNISIFLPITLIVYNPSSLPVNLSKSTILIEYKGKSLCILNPGEYYLEKDFVKPNSQLTTTLLVSLDCAKKIVRIRKEEWDRIKVKVCYRGRCSQ